MRASLTMALTFSALTACHPVPKSMPAAQSIFAPPAKTGAVHLYPGQTSPVLQSRGGDCGKPGLCVVYKRSFWGRMTWQPLQKTEAGDVALLSLTMPVGSAYSSALFSPVGEDTEDDSVIINTIASQPIEAHIFDGLRIGLRQGKAVTYLTAYAIENHPQAGTQKLADNAYLSDIDADVVIANKKAWLLQRRPDGSANLIDLFAVPKGPALCLPGLILDTAGTWAGTPEVALSPDAFISAIRPTPAYEAHKAQLLATCAMKTPKGFP